VVACTAIRTTDAGAKTKVKARAKLKTGFGT